MLTEEETFLENTNHAIESISSTSLTFFHKVVPGTVSSSYGILVARMAGIPEHVAKRASSILATLEHGQKSYRSLVAEVIRPQAVKLMEGKRPF
jgi:DNA mismatch repair ATPase MutS